MNPFLKCSKKWWQHTQMCLVQEHDFECFVILMLQGYLEKPYNLIVNLCTLNSWRKLIIDIASCIL